MYLDLRFPEGAGRTPMVNKPPFFEPGKPVPTITFHNRQPFCDSRKLPGRCQQKSTSEKVKLTTNLAMVSPPGDAAAPAGVRDQAGEARDIPGLSHPRGKVFTFHKPYNSLVRNEAEQSALTSTKACYPLGFRPFRAPRVLPLRGAFSMAMLKPFPAGSVVRREGCHASCLLHGPGGLLTHWQWRAGRPFLCSLLA
jgi:hypothetical protein